MLVVAAPERSYAFAEWLVQALAPTSLTRRELAARTGMSEGAVKGWFHGSIPQRETVNAIARALGADVIEAQRAAGHLPPARIPATITAAAPPQDVPPLTPQEIAHLRHFVSDYTPERMARYRRIYELIGDMSPAAWRRLRRMAESLDDPRGGED
jgi:transcriptional regulator with XRE-family HTH domain